MFAIELTPTTTGEPGGKMTGQKVTHLIDREGPFANAAAALLEDHPAILYHDRAKETDEARKKKAASKTKYTCPKCGLTLPGQFWTSLQLFQRLTSLRCAYASA